MESADAQDTAIPRRSTRQSTRQSEGPPTNKKRRLLENGDLVDAGGDMAVGSPDDMDVGSPDHMDVGSPDDMDVESPDHMHVESQEDPEKRKTPEFGLSTDSLHASQQPEHFTETTGQFEDNRATPVLLPKKGLVVPSNKPVEPSRSGPAKSADQVHSQEDRLKIPQSRSTADYQKTMAKDRCTVKNFAGDGEDLTKKVKPGEFSAKLSDLQSQFPGQRLELWKRTRIHLKKHLQTTRPTEPVSLILAAGQGAEKTLYCLAQGLATAFSAAHNASVLQIDGAATAGQDSDRVKMDIDSQLRAAFEGGDRPAAVIHRLEELPPGSTLIFYRYCDHENAAYKRVFLAFTVLLPLDHLESQQSLKEVEEIVQYYIADRFVGSGSQSAFDRMDADKLSGLWSRISHLVLPVAAESQVELHGCQPS
ncbi:hypothetical protein NHX12_033836 [Muraenolepis orangiensis]|uniref:Torsin-1A-interacting protein 1/2 AAA+ activator domain-containing protein n=1 Tax=Muraenolepis orangiensis TaxID=630683 RepID=A0A9Q0E8G1_9TELE|nr:hypothetical protein NHX12_033836 [Muraenolepis orangiensis]